MYNIIISIIETFFYAPMIVLPLLLVCIWATYMMYKGKNKVSMTIVLLISLLFFLSISYSVHGPRHFSEKTCILYEREAQKVASALCDYFTVPSHIKLPSLDDLVKTTGYIPPENREIMHRDAGFKESDLMVTFSGEPDFVIEITVTSKKGRCPFGESYVLRIINDKNYDGRGSEWINNDIGN